MSADPDPVAPLPTPPALGSLGRLAYGIDGDIYVADADGSNPVRIADGAPSEAGDCGGYWGEGPIWSPDGRYLAYRGDAGEGGSRVTGPSTSATRRATASHRSPVRGGPSRGRPTPPGSLRGSTSTGSESRSTGSTGRARRCSPCRPMGPNSATSTRCGHPMARRFWSPGAWMSPSTGPRRGLPEDDPRSQIMAKYSPNGAEIAYISPDGLGVAAADGSQARVLIPGALDEDFPLAPYGLAWSPTGDRIAFVQASGEPTEMGPCDRRTRRARRGEWKRGVAGPYGRGRHTQIRQVLARG